MSPVTYVHLLSETPPPELAVPPFKAVLTVECATSSGWQDEIAAWLVQSGCLYVMASGEDCEAWHDRVDHANIGKFDGGHIPDAKFIMTTWHEAEPIGEVMWFAATCAEHPTIDLEHTLIVHVAHDERGKELLDLYRLAPEN